MCCLKMTNSRILQEKLQTKEKTPVRKKKMKLMKSDVNDQFGQVNEKRLCIFETYVQCVKMYYLNFSPLVEVTYFYYFWKHTL